MSKNNLELKDLKIKKNKLEKKDINLIIADFDNTIFCRNEQLEDSELLRNNRGDLGNKIIIEQIGLENFINKYYKNKDYPKIISSKLRENHDLILTYTYTEIGKAKIKAVGLDHINYIIVKDPKDKIFETIKYVINNLGFIPSKITIYEDKPEFFIQEKKFIEYFLDTKVEIMFVEMKNNEENPIIKKVI